MDLEELRESFEDFSDHLPDYHTTRHFDIAR